MSALARSISRTFTARTHKEWCRKRLRPKSSHLAPLESCPWMFNPFKPNVIYQHYQLEQSISVLSDVGWYSSCFSNFNRTFQRQTVETLIRCRTLHLVWVCTVWQCPTKRTLGLYRIMSDSIQRDFLSTVENDSYNVA